MDDQKDKTTTSKSEEKKKIKVSAKLQKIINEVEKLTVLELADLVKALEEKFGVSAAPIAVATSAAPAGEAPAEGNQEEKSEFTIVLSSTGANKIAVIKAVREIKSELGLKEAKDFVESTPKELLSGVNKKEAETAKKKLEQAGAQVELK